MLRYRLMLGPVFIGVLVALILGDHLLHRHVGTDPGLLLVPTVAVLLWMSSHELAAILRNGGLHATWRGMAGYSLIGFGSMVISGSAGGPALVGGAGAGVLVVGLLSAVRKRRTTGAIGAMSAAVLAYTYLGIMPGFLILIHLEHGGPVLLGVLLVTKSYDSGAYFVGRWLGRHKLIGWLSPGKTWEGLVGGLVASGAFGAGLTLASTADDAVLGGNAWIGFGVGVLLGVTAQGGDLFASVLKRDAGVKDSSTLVPGFGGLLDMFDSALLAGPVAFWLLVWLDGS